VDFGQYTPRRQSVLRLLASRIQDRNLQVDLDIDPELKSPPMFAAEVAVVMTNLLSNAIKFAGEGGRIATARSLPVHARRGFHASQTHLGRSHRHDPRYHP
jgi:two-component sensor histidine kinase